MKPGGGFIVLEFSKPKGLFKLLFNIYFKGILPLIGRLISADHRAYSYLPESVQEFPEGEDFWEVMKAAGFKRKEEKRLTFGVSSLYFGLK